MNNNNEDLLDEIPVGKVYTQKNIIVGTFLGGFLVAAYMLASNFKTLKQEGKIFATWAVLLLFFLLVAATSFVPSLSNIPNVVFMGLTVLLVSFGFNQYQAKAVQNHLDKGGEVHATGRIVAVVLIGIVIVVAMALIPFILQDMLIA